MGFVLTPEEAQALIDKDPRNRDVLFPYLNGEDLNSRPDQSPSRWVINFKDWPLDRESAPEGYDGPVARDYPDFIRIVEEKVKPERSRLATGDATARDRARRWWQFARPSINFYEAIKPLSRALARSPRERSRFRPSPRIVASEATVVFALEGWAEFGLLQSAIHVVWLNPTHPAYEATFATRHPTASRPSRSRRLFRVWNPPRATMEIAERACWHVAEGLTKPYQRFQIL